MLLFGMSYICLQIFQLIGISHTHFLSYNPNFYVFYVVIDDVMEIRHIFYNRRDLQTLLDD